MGKKQKATGGNAVIYARYSSHNQRDVSIEQQVEACRKHAAELGLTVTATYEDRAISGKTDKRPSFQRMMRDAEQHKFAYVLAWKSNRKRPKALPWMNPSANGGWKPPGRMRCAAEREA